MNKHPELWHRYFRDFIFHKMNLDALDAGEEGIAEKILGLYFNDIHSESYNAEDRIVMLHTYVHVYHLDVSKMSGLFKSLNKVQRVSSFAYVLR